MKNNFKRFVFNGLLLTVVSLIMRGIGVSFNAYISNKIGAEAMGLFTLISTVYGFALTLATSGINLAATRLVSEALSEVDNDGIRHSSLKTRAVRLVVVKCIKYSIFFGSISTILLFLGARLIGENILGDTRTVSSLRILALTLTPIALSSAISGYFTAVRKVYKNALTQVSEQLFKITLCVILLSRFFADDIESACLCIIIGGAVAEFFSLILQTVLYLSEKKDISDLSLPPESKLIRHKLLNIALPVAFSAYVRSALITIEHILIPRGLQKGGASRGDSLAAYGTVQSMVFPIIFFPSAILSSFAGLLVPEIARSNSDAKNPRIKRIINNVFETSLVFSIGTAGIMIFFSYELGNVIYPGTDAGLYIQMIAPLIPIMYLDTAVDALLKGLGEQVYSMGINIVDSLLSVILVLFLLPKYGITGYIITVYFTEFVNASLSITRLLTISDAKPNIIKLVFKPIASVIAASFTVRYLSQHISIPFSNGALCLIFSTSLTVSIYLFILLLLKKVKISRKIQKALEI